MSFTVYIDESGDTGIKTIRDDGSPGSTPFFVLAAVVMPSATTIHARKLLCDLEHAIGKSWRHATDLNHSQTTFFARSSSNLNMRCFAVISRKETLAEYGSKIDWDAHRFYNRCVHYLLECIGAYFGAKGISSPDPDVIFEGRNHNFDALRRYIGKIKDTPHHTRAQNLRCFNPFGFVERAKNEEFLLKFADLTAYSVFRCVNKTPKNFDIPEPRYLTELQRVFGADQAGKVLGHGIKCIHSIEDMKLDDDIDRVWRGMRAAPLLRWA